MTSNQLTYWKNVETERANRISEQLKQSELEERKRANRAQEALTAANIALGRAQLAWSKEQFGQKLDYDYWDTRYKKYGELSGVLGGLQSQGYSTQALGSMVGEGLNLAKSAFIDFASSLSEQRNFPSFAEKWRNSQTTLQSRLHDLWTDKVSDFNTNFVIQLPR